jgi:hypothetical protein
LVSACPVCSTFASVFQPGAVVAVLAQVKFFPREERASLPSGETSWNSVEPDSPAGEPNNELTVVTAHFQSSLAAGA